MPKPLKLKTEKDKCWKAFSLWIRMKYADEMGMVKCVTCGAVKHYKKMHAGHFLSGRGNAVLLDPRGVHPQCPSCNLNPPHGKGGNIEEYYPFMLEKYGPEVIDELKRNKARTEDFKRTASDYKELREQYEIRIRELESGI